MLIIWWFSMPKQLFNAPLSTVVWSKNNELLGARVAKDGQWRFPKMDTVSEKFRQSIIYFEDEYFESHLGFNPVSIGKAFWHNLTDNSKRGGSTITQQVIRLSRQNKSRTYFEKIIELFLATRLEAKYSKAEILKLYTTYAPFGGNVVGLETASWRYFNLPAQELSWSQSASLAVLPNAPSLVFPGKNEAVLKAKRNRLLEKLFENNIIDSLTYKLSLLEALPGKAKDLPNVTPQLTEWFRQNKKNVNIKTTIDYHRQRQINNIVSKHLNIWKNNQVYNASVLVVDIKRGHVVSYVGNSTSANTPFYFVDMVRHNRSTGSLLKPILYANMLEAGELLPQQLVKDTPLRLDNYSPQNFTKDFQGAVPADLFIQKSLNVPAVRLLKDYGIERFMNKLKKLGLDGIDKPADYYGLPLILGGAESNLWELTRMYTHLARKLRFNENYNDTPDALNDLRIIEKAEVIESNLNSSMSPASIYLMLEAMSGLERPGLDASWKAFASSQKIAWKTGTSYGFKDAWSIGLTKDYVVGTWVGNADGTGRPNLVGVNASAPLMFSVFEILPKSNHWFDKPFNMKTVEVCSKSGYLKSLNCPESKSINIPQTQLKVKPCPFHKLVNLTADRSFRIDFSCDYEADKITNSWFVLPPIMAYYYQKQHPEYRALPDFLPNCSSIGSIEIDLIYPKPNQNIIIPKTFENSISEVVFKAAYTNSKILYWHLDNKYIGTTQYFHEMQLQPEPGEHLLTLVGEIGEQIQRKFMVSYTE